jgi:hypothetical protein
VLRSRASTSPARAGSTALHPLRRRPVVEAGVDHECRVTQEEPRKDALHKTAGDVSRKSRNRVSNQQPKQRTGFFILMLDRMNREWETDPPATALLLLLLLQRPNQLLLLCARITAISKRNFCSWNRRRLELEPQLLKGGKSERWIRVREPRTLGIHGDEVVDVSVSAIAPPPPPPRRHPPWFPLIEDGDGTSTVRLDFCYSVWVTKWSGRKSNVTHKSELF